MTIVVWVTLSLIELAIRTRLFQLSFRVCRADVPSQAEMFHRLALLADAVGLDGHVTRYRALAARYDDDAARLER